MSGILHRASAPTTGEGLARHSEGPTERRTACRSACPDVMRIEQAQSAEQQGLTVAEPELVEMLDAGLARRRDDLCPGVRGRAAAASGGARRSTPLDATAAWAAACAAADAFTGGCHMISDKVCAGCGPADVRATGGSCLRDGGVRYYEVTACLQMPLLVKPATDKCILFLPLRQSDSIYCRGSPPVAWADPEGTSCPGCMHAL